MSYWKRNTIINVIMFTRLILGLYSEFRTNMIFAVLARLYCFFFMILGIYIKCYMQIVFPAPIHILITSVYKYVVYVLISLVSMLSNGEHFYEYLNELGNIECKYILKHRKLDLPISLTAFILVILVSTFCFINVLISNQNNNDLVPYFFGMILIYLGNGLNNMTRIIMFELLWKRMKSLRMMIEKYLDFSETVCDNMAEVKISRLEEYMKLYSDLLNNLKFAGHATKFIIVLNLPTYFIYVCSVVLQFKKYGSVQMDLIYLFDGAVNTIIPLVPAILAELVTIQVDRIKIHLNRQLLVCSHDALRNRTCDALKFLELRPFKYTIWRSFSLNISLPLTLISLCTSYIIVVIQFSHIYD
ncbi:uncharacterized protein [Maniola hyperantus]|uniref:uncharacterized protein n=1 Tax=Aphantopus hyperantus TaxID=2795564 RepID=UPI0037490BEA